VTPKTLKQMLVKQIYFVLFSGKGVFPFGAINYLLAIAARQNKLVAASAVTSELSF